MLSFLQAGGVPELSDNGNVTVLVYSVGDFNEVPGLIAVVLALGDDVVNRWPIAVWDRQVDGEHEVPAGFHDRL
jgi:hypothetical protein